MSLVSCNGHFWPWFLPQASSELLPFGFLEGSHAFPGRGQEEEHFILVPMLVTGAKVWHLRRESSRLRVFAPQGFANCPNRTLGRLPILRGTRLVESARPGLASKCPKKRMCRAAACCLLIFGWNNSGIVGLT